MVTVWDVPCPHFHVLPISAWKTTRLANMLIQGTFFLTSLSGIERDAPWLDVFLLAE